MPDSKVGHIALRLKLFMSNTLYMCESRCGDKLACFFLPFTKGNKFGTSFLLDRVALLNGIYN